MRKTMFTLLCAALLSSLSFAQSVGANQVPPTVKKTFLSKHPGAKDVEWEKNGSDYVAQFTQKDDWVTSTFSSTGAWLKSEMTIEESSIPSKVRQKITTEFPGYEISNINKLSTPKETTYDITVDKEDAAYQVIYDSEGIQKSKKKIEYQEEDYEDESDDEDY